MPNYPAGLPGLDETSLGNETLGTAGTADHNTMHVNLADEVNAIAAELGLDPAGDDATVVARLDNIDSELPGITSQAGAPSSTPSKVGDINIDTTADRIYVATDTASSADWDLLPVTGAQIKALYEGEANAYTDTKNTKLAGIETSATADQSDAEIRTALEAATDSNVFTDADHSKLNAVEASATADQSAAEILTAVKTVDGTGSGLDADLVDGLEASSLVSRINHSGFQSASTISDFETAVAAGASTTANTAKTSNVTHTGEVTGSGALVVDKTAVTGQSLVTAVGTDHVLIADASDTGNLKKALISDFASAGGDMAAATYDPAGHASQVVTEDDAATLTNKTLTAPVLDLTQSATPTPTAEGRVEWDTDGNQIVVGDGSGTKVFSDDAVVEARANHTGTQAASTISDFDTVVAAVSEVTANTAKVTNATHTGDVTGDTALTLDVTAISGQSVVTAVGADSVLIEDATDGLLKQALVSDIIGTGAVATDVIWDAKGDIAGGTGANTSARLAVGTNDFVLTAASGETTGMKWAAAAGGGGASFANPDEPSVYAGNAGFLPGVTGVDAVAELTFEVDRGEYFFFSPPLDMTLDTINLDIKTGAGTVVRYILVALDNDWQPNATGLVGQTTSASTAGHKQVTGLSWAVSVGTAYALIVVSDGAIVAEGTRGNHVVLPSYMALNQTTPYFRPGIGTKDALGTSAASDPVTDWDGGRSNNQYGAFICAVFTRS